jgi:hypothetical protein
VDVNDVVQVMATHVQATDPPNVQTVGPHRQVRPRAALNVRPVLETTMNIPLDQPLIRDRRVKLFARVLPP